MDKIIYLLPGTYRIKIYKDKILQDLIFFIFFVALPSSFFALVPQKLFYKPGLYDLNLLFFLCGLIYLIIYFKHLPKIYSLPSGKAFLILNSYLIFQIFYSYFFQEIPLKEIFTIFRKNFFWPLATLGFLLYISTMDFYRIIRFYRILLISTFFFSILYIFSNLTGFDIWGAKIKEPQIFDGAKLLQNIYAIPRYIHILFVFYFVTILFYKEKVYDHIKWIIPFVVNVISFIRNQILVYILYMSVSLILLNFISLKRYIKNFIKISVIFLIGIIFISIFFPKHIDRLMNKFGIELSFSELIIKYEELNTATYEVRKRLIEEAIERTKDNLLFGNGYIRESVPGSYDFVLGSDTFIAPVIYTEGLIGMFFRLSPLLIILIYSMKEFMKKDRFILFYMTIITLIIPQIINYVQTSIFIEYNRWYFIMFSLLLLREKIKEEESNEIS